ncbi:MAG: transcriptional repressor LexA [Clostridia bacterium]|nr:transcriptional repressor LexA [Clostridia bacterium]
MKKLTERQEQILQFIRDYTRENEFPPAVRDICRGVGLSSPASVHAQLKNLREMGYLKRHSGKTRGLSITAQGEKFCQLPMIPILGRVAAGAPVLATEDIEGYVPFDDGGSGYEHFALRVRGYSMKNAGILPEDVIVVRRQMVVNNGDIVVALIEDEATVKTYSLKNGHVWLLPENEEFSPIDGSNAMILGKVVATMRYYQ